MSLDPVEPHATFVVPTHNRADFIGECLLSIEGQTDSNWSITVIDDLSMDDTQHVVRALGIRDLLYLRNDEQQGASKSRNRASFLVANGGIVVYVDSDDRLHPEYLARVRSVFRSHPDAGIVCCDSRVIDAAGNLLHDGASFQNLETRRKDYDLRPGRRSFEDIFVFSTTFPGTAVRRAVLDQVGGFDHAIFPMDDVDLQLRAGAAGVGVYYLDEVLADYRTHPGSASAGVGRAINTCRKKTECLLRWIEQAPDGVARAPLRRRLADAHLELAIALWRGKGGSRRAGICELFRAAQIDLRVIPAYLRWRYGSRRARD